MTYRNKLARAFDLVAMFRRLRWKVPYYCQYVIQPKLIDFGLVEPNFRDKYSGALNRVSGFASIKKNRREGKGSLALLFADIDNFKRFNMHNGHVKGDEVFKRFVQLVEPMLKDEQFIFRICFEKPTRKCMRLSRQGVIESVFEMITSVSRLKKRKLL